MVALRKLLPPRLRLSLLRGAIQRLSLRSRRILTWRLAAMSGVSTITFERDGVVWTVRADLDEVGTGLFVDGGFQSRERLALLGWLRTRGLVLRPDDIVVDVGAHIGSTSIPLVRESGCRAIAIEPVNDNFQLLTRNIEANGLQGRLLTAKKAVVGHQGVVRVCLPKGRSGGNFVSRENPETSGSAESDTFEDVEGSGLTEIIRDAGIALEQVALVWADVQGCEADVISTGAALWQLGVPLWAEIEPVSLQRQSRLATFSAEASAHFDRCIEAGELLRLGDAAPTRPIARLETIVGAISPEQGNTDVLFLPPDFPPLRNNPSVFAPAKV